MMDSRLKVILAALFCLTLAYLGLDVLLWHPGFSAVDESDVLGRFQDLFELGRPHVYLGSGAIQTFFGYLSCKLVGPSLAALHGVAFANLSLEYFLLFWVVRRLAGEGAAAWAVLADLASSTTLMRGRSLLAYNSFPVEFLALAAGLIWIMGRRRGDRSTWLVAMAWGACAAVFMLDYELWFAAAPAAVVVALFLVPNPKAKAVLLAAFLMAAVVEIALFSGPLKDSLAVRHAVSDPGGLWKALGLLGVHAKEYWLGGNALPYISVPWQPTFPLWAWPGLALGLVLAWKRRRLFLLAAVAAFLPLALRSPALEVQRVIGAWLFFCFFAGLGFEAIWQRLSPIGRAAILCLPLVGAAWEGRAGWVHMQAAQTGLYGDSLAQQALARDLKPKVREGSLRLLCHLDRYQSAPERFLIGPSTRKPDPSAPVAALIPWFYAPSLKGWKGELREYAGPGRPAFVFFPAAEEAAKLMRVEEALVTFWKDIPPPEEPQARCAWLKEKLARPDFRDRWLRSVAWKEYQESLRGLGQLNRTHRDAAMAEHLPSSQFWTWPEL